MVKYLLIVESPAKAKTIKKYLWKDWDVVASMGHIEDLPEKKFWVDLKTFEPEYVVISWKKKLISQLKKLVKKYDKVYLATDEDREWEAIAWHLIRVLDLPEDTPRITFHEITKEAIQKAIQNPRKINLNLVNAQQWRRILDRIVWYKLSPLLWEKIKRWLSGGRVQSVAVKLLVERERQIQNFKPTLTWKLEWTWLVGWQNKLKLQLFKINENKPEEILVSEEDIKEFFKAFWFEKIKEKETEKVLDKIYDIKVKLKEISSKLWKTKAPDIKLTSVKKTQSKRNAPAPFITSTLQQAASSNFGWGVKQVMQIAQKLYENWYITYMRTDDPSLSDYAINQAKQFILKNFWEDFLEIKQFKSKSKNAQEAHEAIRPTNLFKSAKDLWLTWSEAKLYELIRARTIASQMTPVVYEELDYIFETADLNFKNKSFKAYFKASSKVLKHPWWQKIYKEEEPKDKDEEKLPVLNIWDKIKLIQLVAKQASNKPPARYTEASLVKKLESLGIWRPSTYAPTISTIQKRWYVVKKDKKLIPTDIAFLVTDYLNEKFEDLMSYDFTAKMEEILDKIAEWKVDWKQMLKDFWKKFKKDLDDAQQQSKVVQYVWRKCPKCQGELVYKFWKFWKFIACENYPDCKYKEQTEEEKSYEQKLKEEFEWKPCPAGWTIVVKKSKNWYFLASSEYPQVKWTMSPDVYRLQLNLWEKFCPKCGKGKLVVRKGKRGYFVGCDRYPECDYVERLKK